MQKKKEVKFTTDFLIDNSINSFKFFNFSLYNFYSIFFPRNSFIKNLSPRNTTLNEKEK